MKKSIVALAISLLLCGCQSRTSEQAQIVYHITDEFSNELKNKEGFQLTARGGLYFPKVRKISLDYEVIRKIDLEEARKLLVRYVTKFLKSVNESEELKPYLDSYPYTPYGIHFTISFLDSNHREFMDGSIASVYLFGFEDIKRTYVHYNVFDSEKHKWVEIHQETYEEAEKIVQSGI
jgi:hypothetical protein